MGEVSFELTPVEEKPTRKMRKGSKYDPILTQFTESDDELAKISVEGKSANYLRTQLNKRIDAMELTGIKVSVINDEVYLEK